MILERPCQYTDTETGFAYLRARYYDPTIAQFLTIDPLVEQTASAYTYTGGNPLNATDPTGNFAFLLPLIPVLAVVAVVVVAVVVVAVAAAIEHAVNAWDFSSNVAAPSAAAIVNNPPADKVLPAFPDAKHAKKKTQSRVAVACGRGGRIRRGVSTSGITKMVQ